MEERYNLEGSQRQTDEFMKPIILNKEGLITGKTHYIIFTISVRALLIICSIILLVVEQL